MNASIIWENPGLVLLGILVGIFLILLLPILSAVRRSRKERRDTSVRRREPSVYDERYDDNERYDDPRPSSGSHFARDEVRYAGRRRLREEPDDDVPDSVLASYDEEHYADRRRSHQEFDDEVPATIFGAGARRRKPPRVSAPVRSFWFAIGVCVGAGGLALLWNLPSSNRLTTVLAFLDRPDASPVADQMAPPAPAETNAQERLEAPRTGVSDSRAAVDPEVGAMIESFVSGLRGQLPMAVGPGITMVNVDSNGNVVALGFTIAQTVAEQDAPKLQNELKTRFQTNVCSTPPEPTNIHGLNERGVSFLINYVDLGGNNVAGLTVGPNYCANPA